MKTRKTGRLVTRPRDLVTVTRFLRLLVYLFLSEPVYQSTDHLPMQILTVDIGTGTQDILLFDSERAPENCLKLVMPSPTLLIGGGSSGRPRRGSRCCSPA